MFKIRDLELENNVLLAPMAGVTDKAFRMITKPFGPALMYTEMVSGKGLFYKSRKTADLLEAAPEEKPVGAQLFGHEPEILSEIASKALEYGAQLIDINMGCPAPKIVNNGDGTYHTATSAWYTVDASGVGADDIFGDPVDLKM